MSSTGVLISFTPTATTSAVRQALANSITHVLTPNTSTDLLLSIRTKLSTPVAASQQRLPYSITFVGVNGVGKSTNLSKVCFWLIQNGFRVLIAACDTFRCVKNRSAGVPAHDDAFAGVAPSNNFESTFAISGCSGLTERRTARGALNCTSEVMAKMPLGSRKKR